MRTCASPSFSLLFAHLIPGLSRRRKSAIDNKRLPPVEEQATVSASASSLLLSTNGSAAASMITNVTASVVDEGNERLPPERQLMTAPSPLPNTEGCADEKAARATATAGATPMTPLRVMKGEGASEAKRLDTEVQDSEAEVYPREGACEKEVVHPPEKVRLSSEHFEASIPYTRASPKMPEELLIIPETSCQQDKQSDISRHQAELRTSRATSEIQDVEKQLQEKERDLQIREAGIQDVEKILQVKERDLQIREAEVQMMLQAVNERIEVMNLQEDNLLQQLAALKELEENPRLGEAALTHQMTILRPPNGAARDSDSLSLSSFSTIRNSIRGNVDLSPEGIAMLKQDSRYHDDDVVSLASTTRGSSFNYTNIAFFSSKSHARSKEDAEYYSNE